MSLRHLPARHPQEHPSHLNGSSILSNTPNPSAMVVSPAAGSSSVPNSIPSSSQAPILSKLSTANEQTWLLIGRVAEQMGDLDHALSAYENALRHNPMSLSGLTQVAGIARIRENYTKAIEYFQQVITLQEDNGEVWSALGHCYLMQDDLQKAYAAYQQALYLLPNPKEDPKLWYGIGILYDRYGSLDHAEEAFASVLRMDKDLDFDKANEILFRLGIIYKQQGKYEESLACFDRILRNPPSPLAHADIWFQIGHVYEQQKDHARAKHAYEKVIADNPNHAKVLQQLGWLYHQDGSDFQNQELAIQHLTKSLECDPSDAQSWYLLGRAYMAGQKYNKAYEAYQQAVYRDGRNPTFWCSIGVLYFQINQFRDALDAYSRAIRINPYISEVWFDLGSLYESCNNQISDAIDAYARASELDPTNQQITQRLQLLRNAQATGGQVPAAPGPQDVHPTAYASASAPPSGLNGPPPFLLQSNNNHRPSFRDDSRGAAEISLPPPSQVTNGRASPPFKGGPPPPVVIDEARHHPSHPPLAPMDVDRPHPHGREGSVHPRGPDRGPAGHQGLLLQHSIPQPQGTPDDLRNGAHPHHADPYYSRAARAPSRSVSPQAHARPRSPQSVYSYSHSARQPIGPAQPSTMPSRSPRAYPHDISRAEQDMPWERRPPPDHRDWDRDRDSRRPRYSGDYPHPTQPSPLYPPRSPNANHHRPHSPPGPSPRSSNPPRFWDSKPLSTGPSHAVPPVHPVQHRPVSPPVGHHELHRRYDPRYDVRDQRDYEVDQRTEQRGYAGSPEGLRQSIRNTPLQHVMGANDRESESPHPTPTIPDRRRRPGKEKEPEILSQAQAQAQALPPPTMLPQDQKQQQTSRRRRTAGKRKDEPSGAETPKFGADRGGQTSNKVVHYSKSASSPEPLSSASSRSIQPSPTSATPRPPSRTVYDDYDAESSTLATDALMSLSNYRPPESSAPMSEGPAHSPTISSGSRHSDPSPRPPPSHRGSVSSTRSHTSPGSQAASLKRALSPGPDESGDSKRSRMDPVKRRVSSPSGRRTPILSTRPSPIPFRTQPASHSPEARQPIDVPYAPSPPPLPSVLPPHPRPIGTGLSSHGNGAGSVALPPIATLSPTPTASSPNAPADRDRDDRMQVDARSTSPPSRSKLSEVIHGASRSPPTKQSSSPGSEKKESL